MSKRPSSKSEPIPEDIRLVLAQAKPLPREILERYEYLREDFAAAVQAAGKAAHRPQPVCEAVFSLAGKLLRWADGVVGEAIAAAAGPQPALAGARSVEAGELTRKPVARLAKSVNAVRLELITWQDEDGTEIEVNAFCELDGSELRPFDVCVRDTAGREIAPLTHVGPAEQAPVFPGPAAGTYVFCVTWCDGGGDICAEFE